MPWWKWAQLPTRGSEATPVQPNSWVTMPPIGHLKVPLYCDGILPVATLIANDLVDLAAQLVERLTVGPNRRVQIGLVLGQLRLGSLLLRELGFELRLQVGQLRLGARELDLLVVQLLLLLAHLRRQEVRCRRAGVVNVLAQVGQRSPGLA